MKVAGSKLLVWGAIAAALVIVAGLVWYFGTQNAKPSSADISVATVNGKDISKKALEDVVAASGESQKAALDKLIEAEVLNQALIKAGAPTSEAEITQNIKAGTKADASSTLNSKLDLLTRKTKAIYQLDESGFAKKYTELKSEAKITINTQL